jgi:hypothetical protein
MEALKFVLSFELPARSLFCIIYVIPYSLVDFLLAHISRTISFTYVTAIHSILSPCSLQSLKSH